MPDRGRCHEADKRDKSVQPVGPMNKTNTEKLIERIVNAKAETVKVGIDQHARDVVVSVQLDGSIPQRAQRMNLEQLVVAAERLIKAGLKVYACYESGPCGFVLYHRLTVVGVTTYVVHPVSLSDGRGQKTDGLDAQGLVDQLDRYIRGNKKAMTVVAVPTCEDEQARAQGRLRGQLKRARHQAEAQGRSLLLVHGWHVTGAWWKKARWEALQSTLPSWMVENLEALRRILLAVDTEETALRRRLEAAAPKDLPKAVGALTWVLLLREMCGWKRFNNRRQVASYTGLCPGVKQTGTSKRDGHINRHGNPRVRALLIELVWRLVRWQPDYPPVQKLVEGVVRGAARRKLAVAAARHLAIDLWRLATKQTTPEKLKLIVPAIV